MLAQLMLRISPGMRIASMGYPDIIATPDDISAIIGNVKLKYLDEAVSARHGVEYLIPDSIDFFNCLDIKLDVYDVVKERGCEIICDLNERQNIDKTYDVVIDVGTLEHCFNIGQALMNMASMVAKDGFIIHCNPFNWGNHGFYGLNPTLYNDFYEQNGFEVVDIYAINHMNGSVHKIPKTGRFSINGECNLIAIARCNEVVVYKYPIQTKYKKLLGEKS
jgi:hypothetical protein